MALVDKPAVPATEAAARSGEALPPAAHRLDLLLASLVVLFAVLVASYRAANSDFLRHAAVGRLIAQDRYSFGSEPFTWAADKHWVNTSWLFDLISYLLYRGSDIGGIVVVALKAASVGLTALVLLLVARAPGRPLLLPAACVGLAILVLSPCAQLRPACLSAVLLAVTLWVLRRPQARRQTTTSAKPSQNKHPHKGRQTAPTALMPRTRSFWLLPLLFCLWANLDSWFLLGPITAGLYLLGELAASRVKALAADASSPREVRTLAVALAVGIVACCVNPFGLSAFATLPAELLHGSTPLQGLFAEWSLSPLAPEYFAPSAGLCIAGIAYFILLLLGVTTFVLVPFGPGGPARLLSWRTLVWLAFAALSLYRARCIAYFAVVAGPIAALNLSDYLARNSAGRPARVERPRLALALRSLAVLAAIATIVATIPGWLQATPHAARRVGWGVAIEPSLQHAAEAIKDWRQGQLVPEGDNWLTLSPDATNYLAWFAPGARGFVDDRLPLFGDGLRKLTAVRRLFAGEVQATDRLPEQDRPDSLFRYLRTNRAFFIVVTTPTAPQPLSAQVDEQTARIANGLFANSAGWVVCHLEGGTAIFAGRTAGPGGAVSPVDRLQVNFRQRAFGPGAVAAPASAPDLPPQARPCWWELWQAPPSADAFVLEGRLHLLRFRSQGPPSNYRIGVEWQALLAVGALAQPTPLAVLPWELLRMGAAEVLTARAARPAAERRSLSPLGLYFVGRRQAYYQGQDLGPPDALFLAIRRGRQAVAASPNDPRAYLLLAQAYDLVFHETRVAGLSAQLPELSMLRRAQIIAAATHVLRLAPPPDIARDAEGILVRAYDDLNRLRQDDKRPYRDVELRHLRGLVEALRSTRRQADEPVEAFAEELHQAESALAALEQEVQKQRGLYKTLAEGKPRLHRALTAWQLGLGQEALDVLHDTNDPQEWVDPRTRQMLGRDLLATLLLDTGELDQLGDLVSPEEWKTDEGLPWRNVSRLAALGDYTGAKERLADAMSRVSSGDVDNRVAITRESIARKAAEILQFEAVRIAGIVPYETWLWRPPESYRLRPLLGDPVPVLQKAVVFDSIALGNALCEMRLLRAWLSLEEGAIAEAKQDLEAAEQVLPSPQHWEDYLRGLDLTSPDRAQLTQAQTTAELNRDLARCCREWLARAGR
jgi:hypothetical protein